MQAERQRDREIERLSVSETVKPNHNVHEHRPFDFPGLLSGRDFSLFDQEILFKSFQMYMYTNVY